MWCVHVAAVTISCSQELVFPGKDLICAAWAVPVPGGCGIHRRWGSSPKAHSQCSCACADLQCHSRLCQASRMAFPVPEWHRGTEYLGRERPQGSLGPSCQPDWVLHSVFPEHSACAFVWYPLFLSFQQLENVVTDYPGIAEFPCNLFFTYVTVHRC